LYLCTAGLKLDSPVLGCWRNSTPFGAPSEIFGRCFFIRHTDKKQLTARNGGRSWLPPVRPVDSAIHWRDKTPDLFSYPIPVWQRTWV